MKIRTPTNSGSALVATIVLTAVSGTILAGYLSYLRQQNHLVNRSIAWNSTIQLAEAGIEEALAQLNQNGAVVANNGFEIAQGKYIIKSRDMSLGNYTVGFSTATNPVIVAQGFAPVPRGDGEVTRVVKVQTARVPMFGAALVTEIEVDINGQKIEIDSFDSGIEAYNTAGKYDRNKRRDKATVATNAGLKDSIKTGGAKVYGQIKTGPGGGVEAKNGSIIGDFEWHAAHPSGGVDPKAIYDDFNMELGTVVAPFTSGFPPAMGVTTNLVSYDYVLGDGDFKIASPLKFKGKVLVTGKARLYVAPDSEISFSGSDGIELLPGASLEIYNASPVATMGGQGVLNSTGVARNLTYFGLPTNTKLSVLGNANFVGAIYAPNTAVVLGGGGSEIKDYSGAIVARSVVFNGTYNFHFDEDLKRARYRNFVATSWEEVGTTWSGILANNMELTSVK